MNRQWNAHVLLGRGGASPGLLLYDLGSRSIEEALSLPAGQSVYAMDASPDGTAVAVGTKAGYLHLVAEPACSENQAQTLLQGAPVLSVCFMDDGHVAASDMAGRCLLWDLVENGRPLALPVPEGEIIYGLFQPDGDLLAGLSAMGHLLLWEWSTGVAVQDLKVSPSPPLLSLVRPIHWVEGGCWAWPAHDGILTMLEWPAGRCRHIEAHEGDFYGITVLRSELLTVGRTDSCLKRWSPCRGGPAATLSAPRGLVSMAAWCEGEPRLLLVDENGKAGIYSWLNDAIGRTDWLPQRDIRVAVSPNPSAYRLYLQSKLRAEAETLTGRIVQQYAKRQLEEVERLHRELERIGYRHVSLALQAQEARRQDDIGGELRAYSELAALIVNDHAGMADSLTRYAQLLERVWQVRQAYSIWRRIGPIIPSPEAAAETLTRLHSYVSSMDSAEYVIDPTDPLVTLITSATALNRPLTGRYVVGSAGPSVRCHGAVSSVDVLERYGRLRTTAYRGALPVADGQQYAWLSNSGVDRVEAVVTTAGVSQGAIRWEYCVKVYGTDSHTVLAPMILIHAADPASGTPAAEHNQQITSVLQRLQEDGSQRTVVHAVHECFKEVIRRLLTRQGAIRLYTQGNEDA